MIKYANYEADDVIYSTQFDIEYMNEAISANLLQNPLKLGTLIALKVTHLQI